MVKNLPANAGGARDASRIPGWERSPGEGHGNRFQYFCLENSMGRGAWQAIIHRVASLPDTNTSLYLSPPSLLSFLVLRHPYSQDKCL